MRRKLFSKLLRSSQALAIVALSSAFALGVGAPRAFANLQTGSEHIESFDSSIELHQDGSASVVETIVYDFGYGERHGIYRYIPTRFNYPEDDKFFRKTPISDIKVASPSGAPAGVKRSDQSGLVELRIGSPDQTVTGAQTYVISYTIKGVVNPFSDYDEFYWNATGDRWEVPITRASTTVVTPGAISKTRCFAGGFGSTDSCSSTDFNDATAHFSQSDLYPYSGLTVVVGLGKGQITNTEPILEEKWTPQRVARAFNVDNGVTLGSLMATAVGVPLLTVPALRRKAKDQADVDGLANLSGDRSGPVQYKPPDDLSAAVVGVMIDEYANPIDVTAGIVQLAVKGYLKIEEFDSKGIIRKKKDYRVTRTNPDTASLAPFEKHIMSGLFQSGADEVELSDLKNKFAPYMKKAFESLYTAMKQENYFSQRPNDVRARYLALGIGVLLVGLAMIVALVVLVGRFAAVGVPVAAFGLAMIVCARFMPARTGKGSLVLSKCLGFKRYMETAEDDRMRFAEQQSLFHEYLPYAIVFGITAKWAKAFEGLEVMNQAPNWYVGPYVFNAVDFGDSMVDFSAQASSVITTTPAASGSSGFSSGGGFSGGGFGGGGGGSW